MKHTKKYILITVRSDRREKRKVRREKGEERREKRREKIEESKQINIQIVGRMYEWKGKSYENKKQKKQQKKTGD